MVTLMGGPGVAWRDELRLALDDAGLAEGSDSYVVLVAEHADMSVLTRLHDGDLVGRRPLVLASTVDPHPGCVWDLLEGGAADVLAWNGSRTCVEVVERFRRWQVIDEVVDRPEVSAQMIGSSGAVKGAARGLVEWALFGRGPLLLVGETGTGKEVASRVAHSVGCRGKARQLVVVDCTTIVPTLSGSELFGHERGAFTGADKPRAGAFATADGGTLFLDEIGDLPMLLQAELLRVIQEGTYKRVGGDVWHRTRFRLICATNKDLDRQQRKGRFRADLYHRIASSVVRLPPLSERTDDLEALFRHFLGSALDSQPCPDLSAPVLAMLHERPFPGNVRELRQLALRIASRHVSGIISPGDVPESDRPRLAREGGGGASDPTHGLAGAVHDCLAAGTGLRELTSLVGDLAVDMALAESGGSASSAARRLGVSDRAVQMRKRGGRVGAPSPRA